MDTLTTLAPFLQLTVAAGLGMILGLERVLAGRTAGPRTYGLVSMGACFLTIISVDAIAIYSAAPRANPFDLVAAVMTGIGFLGTGLIIFQESKVSGLTTAAGIWVSAAIGIGVGFKFYSMSLFATFITLLMFTVVWHLEHKIKEEFTKKGGRGQE
jgi:putative Mg2+ transporter-C (MgtC) family protein